MSDEQVIAGPAPAPSPGLVIARTYELVEELGRGAFGAVWRARDRELRGDVAVKLLVGSPSDAVVKRFIREGEALEQARGPGVVRVRAAGQADGLRYLVMDLVAGVDLDRWLETPRPLPELVAAALGVARALESLHAAGVLHRDLKASNVMLGPDGPVLVDLGLAKVRDGEPLTRVDAGGGTPGKVAPEQWGGLAGATEAADVYALGALLFRMLTGQDPFAAPDGVRATVAAYAVVADQLQRPAQRVSELATGVPEPLVALVDEMLERDQAARPTLAEVIARLEAIEARATAPTHTTPGTDGPAPHHRRGGAGTVGAAVVLVAGLCWGLWALVAPGDVVGAPATLAVFEDGASVDVPLVGRAGRVEVRGLSLEHRERPGGADVRVVGERSWHVTTASSSAQLASGGRRLTVRWLPGDVPAERR